MIDTAPTEKSSKVAFLGPAGTFSQAAVEKHFGPGADKLSMTGIDDVFLAVEQQQADYGVVPVENLTEGAVNYTQDCLMETSLSIIAEVVIAIEHNFLLKDVSALPEIKRIVSHRQSLAQCRRWLKLNWPGMVLQEVSSNAEAARLASEDVRTAAIASAAAAENYGLYIQASNIQDRRDNSTRFLVLARDPVIPQEKAKTSILVYTENKPGALFRVLEPFERNQVSLTKIETRPALDGMWAYVFFIDFEGSIDEPAVENVFSQLKERAVKIKNLGSYPMASAQ
jgi:chorismate mutase / prephenate dehydratase